MTSTYHNFRSLGRLRTHFEILSGFEKTIYFDGWNEYYHARRELLLTLAAGINTYIMLRNFRRTGTFGCDCSLWQHLYISLSFIRIYHPRHESRLILKALRSEPARSSPEWRLAVAQRTRTHDTSVASRAVLPSGAQ